MTRPAFTIMELMVVVGIIGVIAAVVVAAINPTEQLIDAQDAKRRNQVNAIQKALFQYSIDAGGELPNQGSISTDSASPTNICREGLTGSCVVFDSLVPDYLTELPVDPTETGASLTGFAIYTDTYGRANVVANYLGQSGGSSTTGGGGGDTTDPTISSTTPTDDASGSQTGADLTIVFSEAVTKQTGNVTLKRTIDDTTIETIDVTTSAVSVSDDTVTINPSSSFDYSTGVYVQIDGTAFDDSAGNSFAGIATTTEWNFVTGRAPLSNRAYAFDGSNDRVEIANSSAIDLTEDLTLTAWIKPTSTFSSSNTAHWAIFNRQNTDLVSQDSYILLLNQSAGKLHFGTFGGNMQGQGRTWNADTWYHVAATYQRNGGSPIGALYVNGAVDTLTIDTMETMAGASNELWLGDHTNTSGYDPFDGSMFDLRIYSGALTADNITHIYNFGASGTDPGTSNLVAQYKMDDIGSRMYDSSGNDRYGIKRNITSGTFHYTGSDVPYSWHNNVGYSNIENLMINSTDNSGWTTDRASITGGITDHVGTTTALRIQNTDTTANVHRAYESGNSIANGDYVVLWVAGTADTAFFQFTSGSKFNYNIQTNTQVAASQATLISDSDDNGFRKLVVQIDDVGTGVFQMALDAPGSSINFTPPNTTNTLDFVVQMTDDYTEYQFVPTSGTVRTADYAPRNESSTTEDIFGNTLQFSGPSS